MKRLLIILTLISTSNLYCQQEITDDETRIYVGVPNTGITMLKLYSSQCPYSEIMKPIFKKLSLKYNSEVKFYKLDIDKYKDIDYGISETPTFLIFQNEKRLTSGKGVMEFDELETLLLAGMTKDAFKTLIVAKAKTEVNNEYLFLQAWSYMDKYGKDGGSGLEKKDLGTDDIEANANTIQNLKNVKNGIIDKMSVKIGSVKYEIIAEPWKIVPPKDDFEEIDINASYNNAGGGTYFNSYKDEIWPKIEDGIIVKISYYDDLMESNWNRYLMFGVDLISGKYKYFDLESWE